MQQEEDDIEDDVIELNEEEAAELVLEGEQDEDEFYEDVVGTEEGEGGDDDDDGDDDAAVEDNSIYTFSGHEREVYAVAVSNDNQLVVSGGGDDTAYVWRLGSETAGPAIRLASHSDSVVAVCFNFDSSMVATGGMDGLAIVWDARTGEKLHTFDGPDEIQWLSFHPTGNALLAGCLDGTCWMWQCDRGVFELLFVLSGHSDAVACGRFTPNGRRIVTGSADASLKLWDPRTGACLHTFSGFGYHEGGVTSLCFHPTADPPLLASGSQDGSVCVVKLDTKKILTRYLHRDVSAANARRRGGHDGAADDEGEEEEGASVESLEFSPTGQWIASGGTDGRIVIFDEKVNAIRTVLANESKQTIVKLAWVSNVALAAAGADGVVAQWDARSGQPLRRLTGHTNAILDFALVLTTPAKQAEEGGVKAITASDDGTCKVWLI